MRSVDNRSGGLFFVYGNGGKGKFFLWKTIISRLRSESNIVLAVASSGIASLLLPGGRTAHSRFKIPLKLDDYSTCEIKKETNLAKLLEKTRLIVWDEAPMNHRNCFEALDKSLKDILISSDSGVFDKPFGGITVVLGGDFKQILHVISNGKREDIVAAAVNKSTLWKYCKVFRLTKNMRLSHTNLDEFTLLESMNFEKWILDIDSGDIPMFKQHEDDEEATWIKIPRDLLVTSDEKNIEDFSVDIYDDFSRRYDDLQYLKERSIITPTNNAVDEINEYMLSLVPTDEKLYLSCDSLGMPWTGLPFSFRSNFGKRKFQDSGRTCLCSCSATKCFFDLEIPETLPFRRRATSLPTTTLIPKEEFSLFTPREEAADIVKTLLEIESLDPMLNQNIKFSCAATVVDIDVADG